jgi:hypothetical protein
LFCWIIFVLLSGDDGNLVRQSMYCKVLRY